MTAANSRDHTEKAFTRRVRIKAPADRVFDTLATLDGLRGWWTPLVEGSTAPGQHLRFEFEGLTEHIIMRVDASRCPGSVEWRCVVHTALPEWAGTRVLWSIVGRGTAASELQLSHVGLTPDLACFTDCRAGWDRFLGSIVGYAERGVGAPYRA